MSAAQRITRRMLEDRAFLQRAAKLDDAALKRLHRRCVGRTPLERMTLRQRGVELLWRLAKDWPTEPPR